MQGGKTIALAMTLVPLALVWAGAVPLAAKKTAGAYHPHIDPQDFQVTVDNPYFPLTPGTVFKYSEKTRHGTVEKMVTVTYDTKVILGVPCTVVSDNVTDGVALKEETVDWYAQDKAGNVWYFGEDTKMYDGSGKVNRKGSWEAGVDNAEPGVIMQAHPSVGDPYRQEYRKGEAEDLARVLTIDEGVTVPYGSFAGCVKTTDWTELSGDIETKWYARGVGLVKTTASTSDGPEVSTLLSMTRP